MATKKKKEVDDLNPARKALETAARPTLERIEADRSNAPSLIQSVLAHLAGHLFDPDLDVNQLRRACGIRDNSLPIYFHEAVGAPPSTYIEDCRLEVASRLLASSRLKIWQIAQVIGYSTLQVFSRAFTRWSGGQNPSSFRREARQAQATGSPVDVPRTKSGSPPAVAPDSEQVLSRAIEGGLSQEEADDLARLLVKLYPKTFGTATAPPDGPEPAVIDRTELERFYAEEGVWKSVRDLPFDEAQAVVRSYGFSSTALFDLLVAKSQKQGRRDRKRGIELAELALESAEASATALGERIWEQRAMGEAWVGNQKRLALDFLGAEAAFERATEALSLAKSGEDCLAAGLVYGLKGSLRTFQGRYDPAMDLTDRSLKIFRRIGDRREEAIQLIQRATVATYSGLPEKAVSDYAAALEIADELKAEDLALMIWISQASLLANMGCYERAEALLASVDRRLSQQVNPLLLHQVESIEGMVEHGYGRLESAEAKYLAARSGFDDLDAPFYSAFVSLDISILYCEVNRFSEAIPICAEIVSFFESLTLGEEALMSLCLLKDALARRDVTTSILRELQTLLLADPLVEISQ